MAGEEEAMNVIDKLNQEFDEVITKNLQLEKEKLELYKEIHKLKFKLAIKQGDNDACEWGEALLWDGPNSGIGQVIDWSDELVGSMRGNWPLEKNVILKELYGKKLWEYELENLINNFIPHDPQHWPCDSGSEGWYGYPRYPIVKLNKDLMTDEEVDYNSPSSTRPRKLIDTFKGGVFE